MQGFKKINRDETVMYVRQIKLLLPHSIFM
jgi:hypothetical protein